MLYWPCKGRYSMASYLITHGILVDTEWKRGGEILVTDGKISAVAPHIDSSLIPSGTKTIDAQGLYVLPGLIDAHTHYHLVSRGTVTCDSFPQGSRLAAYGGVTTVVDFADDDKKGDLSRCTDARKGEMAPGMAIDYTLHQGVYSWRPSLKDEMQKLSGEGVRALKMFTTYKNTGYLVEDPKEMRGVFQAAKDNGMMVCVHCEDEKTLEEIEANYQGDFKPAAHAVLRPSICEARGIHTVGMIAHDLHMPLYVVHLSSKAGLEEVRYLRSIGTTVIVETTPTYLFLDRSLLDRPDGSLFVMTPPLRDKEDNLALQEAVLNGEVQVIATDHCAFTHEQKLVSSDCRSIYPGIPGTEELLPLVNTFFQKSGKAGLSQLVDLLSTGPAKAFGIWPEKGSLRAGTDADITLFDPDEEWTLSKDTLHSASGYTAYEGRKVRGRAKLVMRRGEILLENGEYKGVPGSGRFVSQGSPCEHL